MLPEADALVERARRPILVATTGVDDRVACALLPQPLERVLTGGGPEPSPPVVGVGADGLELPHRVLLVVPAEDVGGKPSVRSFDHAVEVGAIGPHLHDLPVALLGHAR